MPQTRRERYFKKFFGKGIVPICRIPVPLQPAVACAQLRGKQMGTEKSH